MTENKNPVTLDLSHRLFESGRVHPDQENHLSVEVNRGMVILTREGREAGKVAAVMVNSHSQKVTHLLLVRPRRVLDYRLVPVDLIEQVDEESVQLHICSQTVETLPTRQIP